MNGDTEIVVKILGNFIIELIELRRNDGTIAALRHLFNTVNKKLTRVEEVLVKFLKRLVHNFTMNQKEVSIDNTVVTKLGHRAYSPQSILTEEEDAKEFVIFDVSKVLGITVKICKLDLKELSVSVLGKE